MEKSIPFFKIGKGSKVALYGCGNNGVTCYKQLIKSGYCNLAVIVDNNYVDKALEGEEVKPISELEVVEYDYVLITILDDDISQQVRNSLMDRGILEEKIITLQDKAIPLALGHIEDKGYMQEYLDNSFKKMYGLAKKPGEYYQELEALLIENSHNKSDIFNQLKMLLNLLKDGEKKFVLLVLMYKYGYFDKQCMEFFMKCMNNSEWHDDTYYEFIIDSTVMVFLHPDYIYNDFFIDRKVLQKRICEYYKLYDVENIIKPKKRKIAIVTLAYTPDSFTDPLSVLVRNYAMKFIDMGYDVKIFVLRSDIAGGLEKVFLIQYVRTSVKSWVNTMDELTIARNMQIGEELSVNLQERLQSTVKSIIDYQPSFILDMADERFPEAYALIQYFPIINLPIRGNAYSSEADIYLSIDINKVKKDNCMYHVMPLGNVREVLLSYLGQREKGDIQYKREKYGIQKEDFVMVTVGRRLQLEIDDEMIKSVCQLLDSKNNIKWILVGDGVKSDDGLFNHFLRKKRIINWGYEEYLESLYQICDIYLNPNRIGGGVSIRRAMLLGLPIAMTDFPSDALSCMPPAYIVHGGYGALMEYVAGLCENQELYQRVSEETLKRTELFTSKSDAEKILKVCEEAVVMQKQKEASVNTDEMKRLLIWGTGNLANRFIDNKYNGEIIGFIETNKSLDTYMGKPVYSSQEIPKEYDYIIIANSYATEIYNLCLERNIDTSKVIFLYGVKQRMGCASQSVLKEILLERNYTLYCAEFGLLEDTFIKTDADTYRKLNKRPGFAIQKKYMWPIIEDKYAPAGTTSNYFWQDLWAAKLIVQSKTKKHFDIGSRLDGFIAHLLAAGIDVTMIDIRKFPGEVEHLHTIVDDATTLHQIPDESIESMSALCSLEHFGLGRYGDPVDPEACFKCFDNIQRKLKKGGKLYISAPIGKERVEFNAHRVFYASTIVDSFKTLNLEEFSCTSQGKMEHNVDIHKYDNDQHNGEYRYGLFSFVKSN